MNLAHANWKLLKIYFSDIHKLDEWEVLIESDIKTMELEESEDDSDEDDSEDSENDEMDTT